MIKLALPTGDLRRPLAALLERAGLRVQGYGEGSRAYRLPAEGDGPLRVRVFRERDIPIQIALGNYDIGICGLHWVEEFLCRYPRGDVVRLGGLPVGGTSVWVAAASGQWGGLRDLAGRWGVRIVSEFPNLAEAFALAARLPAYRVVPVWGAAEAYPPEDADLAVVAATDESALAAQGLAPLHRLLQGRAWVIVNRHSLRGKDMGWLLSLLADCGLEAGEGLSLPPPLSLTRVAPAAPPQERTTVRIALPDGHQQRHVLEALAEAGLEFEGYAEGERRPRSRLEGVEVKVVRPQDMPQMVALGNFDLAVSGRDCLLEHLYRFPSSPVEMALDLGRGAFNVSAVVAADLPAESLADALRYWRERGVGTVRIASEFVSIADHYARSRHFWRYRVIPTAGASEGFVPEDAELLIEGTETGRTLVENQLKAIDVLFRSTTCVIVRRGSLQGPRGRLLSSLLERLARGAVAASARM
ncbi:MAG: ATP phosphoribosyltransferase [Dehalococcoidia bacterium]|nr:ATP phosphoribosyltransferase [Dehalococcoidia bacterium]MDW8008823.1 ATP phosphoribosyltransferase [Chloroflexota bacterium]